MDDQAVTTLPTAPWSDPELIQASCLAVATIRGEAGQEPYEGKLAVARVIRERMRLRYSSDGSVAGTVLWPLQFSMWNTHDRNRIRVCKLRRDDPHWEECIRAWNEACAEPEPAPEFKGVVLYHASWMPKKPSWATRAIRAFQIGRHIFYKERSS